MSARLEKQVQLLADRLAIKCDRFLADRLALALCEFRELELEFGIAGDIERSDYYRQLQDVLVGKYGDAFEYLLDVRRRDGNYTVAMNRIRESLRRLLRKQPQREAA